MELSKLQTQVTQILAEAFNLLSQATLVGLTGGQVASANASIQGFQSIISSLAKGELVISQPDDSIIEGEVVDAN